MVILRSPKHRNICYNRLYTHQKDLNIRSMLVPEVALSCTRGSAFLFFELCQSTSKYCLITRLYLYIALLFLIFLLCSSVLYSKISL